ncbi:MAG: glycine--tRNA ligase [Thermoplasmata archaeon]|nr:glycine--tRNA ligase [Thermoplasmata archaeon]
MSEDVQSLAKRRGFIWQSAEIYGSMAGFYDYGAMGARLKRNWENVWLKYFMGLNDNYHLIDSTNILPEAALKASGHVDSFTDPLVECTKCGHAFRADQLIEEATSTAAEELSLEEIDAKVSEIGLACPKCKGPFGKAMFFNMMFPIEVGTKGTDRAYLRPETAQGAYLNFKRHFEIMRRKLPLGLAIIGKAYRNEIAPRQGVYRMREFIQAELQIFMDPETFSDELDLSEMDGKEILVQLVDMRGKKDVQSMPCRYLIEQYKLPDFYVYHMLKVQEFYLDIIKIPKNKFRFYEKSEKERAFYNRVHFDIEVDLSTLGGFRELAGLHYRGDYDLTKHQIGSKEKMEVSLDGRKLIPHVLELSFGVDRNVWALLDIHLVDERTGVLKLPPQLAPYTFAVFPLMKKDELIPLAKEIHNLLKDDYDVCYDQSGSIGKRYARMDEIGTPFCITVDFDGLTDDTVTLRDTDTTEQKRVKVDELERIARGLASGKLKFKDLN